VQWYNQQRLALFTRDQLLPRQSGDAAGAKTTQAGRDEDRRRERNLEIRQQTIYFDAPKLGTRR
jgi:hypothetical protein